MDDRNSNKVTEITLSNLVTFSNNLLSLKHDACLADLKGERFCVIMKKITTYYPELCNAMNNQLMKQLKLLVEASILYYNLDCDNLMACCKKLEHYSSSNEEHEVDKTIKEHFSSSDILSIQNCNVAIDTVKSQGGEHIRDFTKCIHTIKLPITNTLIAKNELIIPNIDNNNDSLKRKSFIDKTVETQEEKNEMRTIIQQHVTCLKTIIDSMNLMGETIKNLQEVYYKISQEIIPSDQTFNEEYFSEIIENFESKKEIIMQKTKEFANDENYFYIKNTFSLILSQLNEDSNTLLCLLKGYHSILIMDHLTAMESTVTVTKKISKIESKHTLMCDIKLFIFFIQFSFDNEEKMELIFTTYYENKKNMLLIKFKNNDEPITLKNNASHAIIIKDQILELRPRGHERIIHKCFEENYEMYYFALIFEKKHYMSCNNMSQNYEGYKKYCFDTLMFIDSDDDNGLVSILHVGEGLSKTLLKDYKNSLMKSNSNSNNTNSNISKEEGKSKNGSMIINNFFYSKLKLQKNVYLLTYKISNYLSIIVKIKEKYGNEIGYITEVCKDFRQKFTNCHILKNLCSFKKRTS